MSFLFFFYLILRHTVTSHAGTPARERKKKKWKRGRGFNSNFFRFFPIFFFFFFFYFGVGLLKKFSAPKFEPSSKKRIMITKINYLRVETLHVKIPCLIPPSVIV